jgi:hypothetical protein
MVQSSLIVCDTEKEDRSGQRSLAGMFPHFASPLKIGSPFSTKPSERDSFPAQQLVGYLLSLVAKCSSACYILPRSIPMCPSHNPIQAFRCPFLVPLNIQAVGNGSKARFNVLEIYIREFGTSSTARRNNSKQSQSRKLSVQAKARQKAASQRYSSSPRFADHFQLDE